jgi:AbrB family looped-hinge helix DNA binding protein
MSETFRATIHENGRVVIPKALREKLGVDGLRTVLIFEVENDEVTISSRLAGIRRAQKLMQELDPDGTLDDFLQWRREQTRLELEDYDRQDD